MSHFRVAICLSGSPKAIVQRRMQDHWNAVVEPLRSGSNVHVDVFLHLDVGPYRHETLERVAARLRATTLKLYNDTAPVLPRSVPSRGSNASQHSTCPPAAPVVGECLWQGYMQASKWAGCLDNIVGQERLHGAMYDRVVRMRPDLEYYERLPPAPEWVCLRHDVALTLIAMRSTLPCHPGQLSKLRLYGHTAPATERTLFVDDNLAILPREAAQAYFGIARGMDDCVSTVALNSLCQQRWSWPECRVQQALASVPHLFVGEVLATRQFAIVDCHPEALPATGRQVVSLRVTGSEAGVPTSEHRQTACRVLRRRACCGRDVSERAMLPRHASGNVHSAVLSTSLNTSTFGRCALSTKCVTEHKLPWDLSMRHGPTIPHPAVVANVAVGKSAQKLPQLMCASVHPWPPKPKPKLRNLAPLRRHTGKDGVHVP